MTMIDHGKSQEVCEFSLATWRNYPWLNLDG